jgi:deoxycytidylate deaminase
MPSGFENNCENHGDVICEHIWSQIVTHHPWADGAYTCTKCNKQADSIEPDFGYEYKLITKPECLHAESNAIMKVARSHASSIGGTMYCTLSPCLECAKLIIQAGIIRVVYSEQYPYPGHTGDSRAIGLDLLRKAKIRVDQLDLSNEKVV